MTPVPFDPVAGGPCATLADAAVHLRRPFTPALVQAKLQSQGDGWGEAVFYVDARAVIDRLNVLLPGRWHADYELVTYDPPPVAGADPALVYCCRLTAAEATYADVGEGFDPKAARSDALKRAAVHVGIGHCLYRIGAIRMTAGEKPSQLRGDPGELMLDDANRRWLRGRYQAWLTRAGIAEYGLPLDHGAAARRLAPELFPDAPPARRATRRRRPSLAAAPAAAPPPPSLAPAPSAAAPPATEWSPPVASAPPVTAAAAPADAEPTPATPARPFVSPLAIVTTPPGPAPSADTPGARVAPAPVSLPAPTDDPPAEPPASPEQRAALVEIARQRGYGVLTLQSLAVCVKGASLDQLDERALHDLRAYLDSAAGGHVAEDELAARIAQGVREATTAEPAHERLARWLLAREERAAGDSAA